MLQIQKYMYNLVNRNSRRWYNEDPCLNLIHVFWPAGKRIHTYHRNTIRCLSVWIRLLIFYKYSCFLARNLRNIWGQANSRSFLLTDVMRSTYLELVYNNDMLPRAHSADYLDFLVLAWEDMESEGREVDEKRQSHLDPTFPTEILLAESKTDRFLFFWNLFLYTKYLCNLLSCCLDIVICTRWIWGFFLASWILA